MLHVLFTDATPKCCWICRNGRNVSRSNVKRFIVRGIWNKQLRFVFLHKRNGIGGCELRRSHERDSNSHKIGMEVWSQCVGGGPAPGDQERERSLFRGGQRCPSRSVVSDCLNRSESNERPGLDRDLGSGSGDRHHSRLSSVYEFHRRLDDGRKFSQFDIRCDRGFAFS